MKKIIAQLKKFNETRKRINNYLNTQKKYVSNIKIFTKKYIFFILTLANLLILGKYHNILIYTYTNTQIIHNNFLIKIIIMLNWIFGFAFIPSIAYYIYYFKNGKYWRCLSTVGMVIGIDLGLSFFAKSGAIGFYAALYLPPIIILILSLTLIIGNYLVIFKRPKTPSKIKKIREIMPTIVANKHELPPINILTIGQKANISINLEAQKKILMQTLKDFGIDAKIIDAHIGPVVTLYSVELAAGIKSVRLINLDDDIARSMQAFSARIATIPGKNLIGIEIANQTRQTVYFKEGMQTDQYKHFQGALPLYLGANIYGEHEIFDLAAMPHLLVAGTTGSGKSVGIHTMILSMLFKLLPSELKLILIDPKKLELTPYEDIPHLLLPVVTEPKMAISALKWAVKEMEDRYKKMSKIGVRNITGYNTKIDELKLEEKMPFIVVIIDEMADLMLVAGKEIEICVQRLAQMGRAAGIHMIMATQRPSVDIITGTIKANFPTRISFKLASKIDSRTILGDMSGAEQLLGAGDMLYLATNGKLHRIHGSFVSENDVLSVVNFWKQSSAPEYIEIENDDNNISGNFDSSNEQYYQEAIELIRSTKKVSTSFLQRNFPIGYNRAAKIIEQMEKDGIISKGDKFGRNREIL